MVAVKVVISLSEVARNEPAIGYLAASSSSIVIALEPPFAMSAAVSAASPSLPGGSMAEPLAKSSLIANCGSFERCTMTGIGLPMGAGAADAAVALLGGVTRATAVSTGREEGVIESSAGGRSMPAGIGSFESVVITKPLSVK